MLLIRWILFLLLAQGLSLSLWAQEAVPPINEVQALTAQIRTQLKEQKNPTNALTVLRLMESAKSAQAAVERFAYAQEAIAVALIAQECGLAIQAQLFLTEQFSFEGQQERISFAGQLVKSAKSVVDASLSAQFIISLIRELTLRGDSPAATLLMSGLSSLSNRHKDPAISEYVKDLPTWITEASAQLNALPTQDLLNQSTPEDEVVLGLFDCLYREDWDAGLKRLSQSSSIELAALAKRSLDPSLANDDKLSVAEAWWSQSLKYKNITQLSVQWYAAERYRQLTTSGLNAQRIRKRLDEIPYDFRRHPGSVDLWPLLTLTKGTYRGSWKSEKGVLIVDENERGDHLTIPVYPHGDYRFEVSFDRLEGEDAAVIYFPVMASNGPVTLNCFIYPHKKGMGLHRFDEEVIFPLDPLARMTVGQRQTLFIDYRQAEGGTLTVHIEQILAFSEKHIQSHALRPNSNCKPSINGSLALGAWKARIAFYHARLTMINGYIDGVENLKVKDGK